LLDSFTPANGSPIREIPHAEYYGANFILGDDELVLPDDLRGMLNVWQRLRHDDRLRFIRAARWIMAARDLWDYHASSYYIALIASIEALSSGEPTTRCSECNQVKEVTRRFSDFVDRYALPGESDEVNKRDLYALRSQLAHGGLRLDIDETEWATVRLTPNWLTQREAFDTLSQLTKRVVVGWLRHHAEVTTTSGDETDGPQ